MIWNSATWPPVAPELAVMDRRTSETFAVTGMVTELLLVDGLNVYVVEPTRFENVLVPVACPSTWMVCVRVAHTVAGFSFTTMLVMLWFAPRLTVSVFGYVFGAPSQYVVTLLSFALVATYVCCTDDALIVLPMAR